VTALLPALLCGGGMLACFLMMSRMHRGGSEQSREHTVRAPTDDTVALREEVAKLRGELRERDEREREVRDLR
jgi:hypothetical protein